MYTQVMYSQHFPNPQVRLLHVRRVGYTLCEHLRVFPFYTHLCLKGNIGLKTVNLLMTNVPHLIETSQLICIANQLIGFYMMGNIGC